MQRLCNSGKHFKIDRYTPTTSEVDLSSVSSLILKGPGGESIHVSNRNSKIKTASDETFELMEFAIKCFEEWDNFLVSVILRTRHNKFMHPKFDYCAASLPLRYSVVKLGWIIALRRSAPQWGANAVDLAPHYVSK